MMKKNILLATAIMLLSATALKANADSNSAQLNMFVMGIQAFEITKEKYLGFGVILESEAGRKVVVTTDGKLGEDSTATMMSTASLTNQMVEGHTGSFNEAVFRIEGGASYFNDEDALNLAALVNFSDTSVELKSTAQDSITCGTVTDFTTHFTVDDDSKIRLHIGGTLITNDLRGTNANHSCYGNTTITIVMNDEVISQLGRLP